MHSKDQRHEYLGAMNSQSAIKPLVINATTQLKGNYFIDNNNNSRQMTLIAPIDVYSAEGKKRWL